MSLDRTKCSVATCDRPYSYYADDVRTVPLCTAHHLRVVQSGAVRAHKPVEKREPDDKSITKCQVPGCDQDRLHGRRYNGAPRFYICKMHENRYDRHGTFESVR